MTRRVGVDKFAYVRALRGRPDLTPAEYQLLITVWSYTDQNGRHARPGYARLATDLCKGERVVRRQLQDLIDKGYLAVMSIGGGRKAANAYALALPIDAIQPPLPTENLGAEHPPFTGGNLGAEVHGNLGAEVHENLGAEHPPIRT